MIGVETAENTKHKQQIDAIQKVSKNSSDGKQSALESPSPYLNWILAKFCPHLYIPPEWKTGQFF
jgi:hypothetical protein